MLHVLCEKETCDRRTPCDTSIYTIHLPFDSIPCILTSSPAKNACCMLSTPSFPSYPCVPHRPTFCLTSSMVLADRLDRSRLNRSTCCLCVRPFKRTFHPSYIPDSVPTFSLLVECQLTKNQQLLEHVQIHPQSLSILFMCVKSFE